MIKNTSTIYILFAAIYGAPHLPEAVSIAASAGAAVLGFIFALRGE